MEYAVNALVAVLAAGLTLALLAVRDRIRPRKDREYFACRTTHLRSRPWRSSDMNWCRLPARAAWAGSALIVRTSPLSLTPLVIPVVLPPKSKIENETPATVSRLGARPQSLLFEREDGRLIKIAVRNRDRTKLAGPFLAAAIAGLPAPPRARRHPGS